MKWNRDDASLCRFKPDCSREYAQSELGRLMRHRAKLSGMNIRIPQEIHRQIEAYKEMIKG